MNLKALKVNHIIRLPLYIFLLMLIVVIVTIVLHYSRQGEQVFDQRSTNPESVIPPVPNEGYENTPGFEYYFRRVSFSPLARLHTLVYDWQDIFDIFISNQHYIQLKYSLTGPGLENISRRVREDKIHFFKGNSDAVLAEFGETIKEECKYYKIDWRLILAMIKQESDFTSNAVSRAGAYGFMQIMPQTGAMLEQTLLLDDHRSPKNNIIAGIYYFALLTGRYESAGDTNKYKFALAAYNAGSGHVEDAMSVSYFHGKNYWDWDVVKEDLKLLGPENDSLHMKVWGTRPPNGLFSNWREPYYYVMNIFYYWGEYKRIYPLDEDKPKKKVRRKQ